MRIAAGNRIRKLGELTMAGLLGVLVISTDDLKPYGMSTDIDRGDSVVAVGVDSVWTLPPAPSLGDSLRAESELSAAALRRPLERYLERYSDDRILVRRISQAVLRESRRQQVPLSLIAGVLLTENTTLRPEAESSVGAQGLMQVMPMHAGARLCNSSNLVDVDSNICHGTLILARNLHATSSSVAALLRYNGCVHGTNTPDCRQYPDRVLARASLVRHEILASAEVGAVPGPVQLAAR